MVKALFILVIWIFVLLPSEIVFAFWYFSGATGFWQNFAVFVGGAFFLGVFQVILVVAGFAITLHLLLE